jgi:AcrR family transcriptional regulator
MSSAPEPKRRDAIKTKARILSAAHDVFAELGYAKAGVRDIAQRADVASSLLARHFGTKAALFEQVLVSTIENNSVFTLEKENFGKTMARLVVEQSNINITAILVLALADPEAKEMAMRVARDHIIGPLAEWLGPPNALARATNMYSLLTGFTIQTRAMSSEKIPAASVEWLAQTLQQIVDSAKA